jgi:hypothetical protein
MDTIQNENIPEIHGVEDLKKLTQKCYTLEPIMATEEIYEDFFQKMYNIIKGCFEIKECREYPITFKFYTKDTETYTVQLRHFIINLILWEPFVLVNTIKFLNKNYIMDGTKIIATKEYDLDNWISYRIIIPLRNFNVREVSINKAVSKVCYKLRGISLDFSLIMNLNFSYFTFDDMYRNNDRIKDIMECSFDDAMQPRDVELKIENLLAEEVDIYKKSRNAIGVIMNAQTGIKIKQFGEFTIAQGLKPTLDGAIMTHPIENSTLIRGLDRPSYVYIDGSAARKSLILNKTVMGTAGNFGKLTLQLARTLELSTTLNDCDTKHFLRIKIQDKKMLHKFDHRYYKVSEDQDFQLLDGDNDKFLIGEEIILRSPVTCALGDKICAKCVGRTAGLNYDIAAGISGFESEEITKELEQNVLSSKHLLTTHSEVLKFNDAFDKFFTLDSGEVYPIVEDNDEVDINKYAIYISPSTINKVDEMDEESSYNTYISGGMFYVVNLDTKEMTEIKLENEGKAIFLADDVIDYMKKGKGYIKFKDLENDTKIFEMSILNDELTKPLYEMMGLLNKSHKDGEIQTIDEMVQKFTELLVISGIKASALSGEIIINRLIRSIKHKYDRPDFTNPELEPYEIITIAKALEENKSPGLGLSVQYIKRQLLSDEIVTERTGTSYIDPFLKPKVPNLYDIYGPKKMKPKYESKGVL